METDNQQYFTYVIKSKEGLHYTGMTEDLDLRLKRHNDKSLSFWTKRDFNRTRMTRILLDFHGLKKFSNSELRNLSRVACRDFI